MRKTGFLAAAAMLLWVCTAGAEDLRTGTKQFSIFVTDPSYSRSSSSGSSFSGGAGLALSYVWAPHWSTEFSVAAHQQRETFIRLEPIAGTGALMAVDRRENVRTYPIELLTTYHFTNQSRWTPFVGAGVRYVGAPSNQPSAVIGFISGTPRPGPAKLSSQTSAEAAGGVSFGLTPAVSLNLEARRLLRTTGVFYDPLDRVVFGVSWRF